MAYTQADINNLVNQIVNEYTPQGHVAYFGSYPGECSVPVAYYVDKLRGTSPAPSMANNRADGWGVAFPAELAPYFSHEAYQAGKQYPKGTILMWNSPHIAIVMNCDGSNIVEVFEQNADPDGSPCGIKSRVVNNSFHTCTYALVPIIQVDNPQPVCAYEDTDPHTMQVKLQPTNWWNLNVFSGDINDFHPAAFLDKGTHFLIGGYAVNKHFPQYKYAMSPDDFARAVNGDYSTNNGVNVLDLEEIPAPVPEPIPVYTPPAGAITVPITMNMLKIVTTIMTWPSATDAANRTKAATTIPPGDYQVLKTGMNQMLYVTKPNDPNKRKFWINPQDNTTEKPTPLVDKQVEDMAANAWKKLTPLHPNGKPEQFVMLRSFEVTDLANPQNTPHSFPQYYEKVWVYGTFNKDGITYAALHRSDDPAWTQRYAIPWKNEDGSDTGIIEAYQVLYSPETDVITRKAFKALTLHDREVLAVAKIEKYVAPAVKFIDGIIKRPKKPLK